MQASIDAPKRWTARIHLVLLRHRIFLGLHGRFSRIAFVNTAERLKFHLARLRVGALDLALPSECCSCDEPATRSVPLCGRCVDALRMLSMRSACGICSSTLPHDEAPCGRCKGSGIRPFKRVAALSKFEGVTRNLIHNIKYDRRWPLAAEVGRRMLARENIARVLDEADLLVPVPLHWWRKFWRGFNQSEVLAEHLAAARGLPVVNAVRRVRSTISQTAFHSRKLRVENLKDAFALRPGYDLAGKRIVLVDDVLTSGATIRAVARTLTPVRPRSISAIVIGMAAPMISDLFPI